MKEILNKILRFKKWLILLVVVLALASFGYAYYQEKNKPVSNFKVIQAERADLTSVVSATGTISPVNKVDVSSKITGLIKEVKVQENERVTAGQVLIILDDTHLRALVAQAEARLNNTSANYERMSKLRGIGAIPPQQLDTSRMEYSVAQAAYQDAVSQLEDTVIRAPIDGVVVGKPIPAGQTVSPGISTPMILLTVADLNKMQIDALIDESDIGKITLGQKVTFTVDAYSGKTFTGVVSNVSNKAVIQQNVVYYTVIINVDSPEGLLKPTMTARVSVNVGESKNAIVVPLSALKESKGKKYVAVMRDGNPVDVIVTTGLIGEDRVEILSGLNEGDELVLKSSKTQPGGNSNRQSANTMRKAMGH